MLMACWLRRMCNTSSIVALVLSLLQFSARTAETETAFCKEIVEAISDLYVCQEYTVETYDGFILVLHRLSSSGYAPKRAPRSRKSPVVSNSPTSRTNEQFLDAGKRAGKPEPNTGADQPYATDSRLDVYPQQPFSKMARPKPQHASPVRKLLKFSKRLKKNCVNSSSRPSIRHLRPIRSQSAGRGQTGECLTAALKSQPRHAARRSFLMSAPPTRRRISKHSDQATLTGFLPLASRSFRMAFSTSSLVSGETKVNPHLSFAREYKNFYKVTHAPVKSYVRLDIDSRRVKDEAELAPLGPLLEATLQAPSRDYAFGPSPAVKQSHAATSDVVPTRFSPQTTPNWEPSVPTQNPTLSPPPTMQAPPRDNAIRPSPAAAQSQGATPDVVLASFSPQTTPVREPSVPSPNPRLPPSPASLDVLSADPVLLLHQEFLNGASWFMYTDDAGGARDHLLPFSLVDAGYDVWIGHHRATLWGHHHRYLSHEDQEYWAWSWDDLAEFDISALLGFVFKSTKLPVHLIGVSQSATAGAAAATMSKVQPNLKSLTLLGPTVYTYDTKSDVLEAWAYVLGRSLDQVFYESGYQHGAFNFSTAFPPFMSRVDGRGPIAAALNSISGPNCCLGSAVISFNNGWDGTTSFKNLLHIQQGLRKRTWSKFDYGDSADNMVVYGTATPPAYNPADIPASLRVFVVYGGQDATAPPAGVSRFMSELSAPAAAVYLPRYAHADLTFSTNRTSDVFKPLIKFLDSVDQDSP